MSADKKPSIIKQAAMQITAGGSAGFIEVCLMHPLDVVKTRLQLQVKQPLGLASGNKVRFAGLRISGHFVDSLTHFLEIVSNNPGLL